MPHHRMERRDRFFCPQRGHLRILPWTDGRKSSGGQNADPGFFRYVPHMPRLHPHGMETQRPWPKKHPLFRLPQRHGKGLRLGGGENLCGSCHTEKQQGFAHATHHNNGLRCNTCHFPQSAAGPDAIMGTGAPGHNFAVGPHVCARCHEETVHKSSRLSDLRARVSET